MFADIPFWALPVLFVPILPNLWAIWHLYKNEFPTNHERAAWIAAQVILPVIGGVGYIIFGRKRAIRKI